MSSPDTRHAGGGRTIVCGYTVASEYGEGFFMDEQDAVQALLMLAPYSSLKLDAETVKGHLDNDGEFLMFPLRIFRVYRRRR